MIEICDKAKCCGCEACRQICPVECIAMATDERGFAYPVADASKCIGCGKCDRVCPVVNEATERKPLKVLAAMNRDTDVRLASSSGGIFMALADNVIAEGGVVFGDRFNKQWGVEHGHATSMAEAMAFQGSKYVQSPTGDSYRQALDFLTQGRSVIYSGTPCQIAGLQRFLGNRERGHLITVDIVCHGVPSPHIWADYIARFAPVSSVRFRDKSISWQRFSMSIDSRNHKYSQPLNTDTFLQGFLNNLYLRPSCYECAAKCGKSHSDITLADFWGIDSVVSGFNDGKGTSLVLVNTILGQNLIQQLDLRSHEVNYESALRGNSAIERSVAHNRLEEKFWARYDSDGLDAITWCLKKLQPSLTRRFAHKVLCIMQELKHKTTK